MELNLISSYPVLFSDLEIKELKISIEEAEQLLKDKKEQFQKRVSILQQFNCGHKFQKIMEFDKNYCWDFYSRYDGTDVMKGKECTECGLFVPRPKGQPWDICYKCCGKMESLGKTPGQGGDGEHVYKCKDCGHQVSHT